MMNGIPIVLCHTIIVAEIIFFRSQLRCLVVTNKSLLGQQYAQQVDRLREPLQEQIRRQVKWLVQQREINQQRKLMWNHAATMLDETPLPTLLHWAS